MGKTMSKSVRWLLVAAACAVMAVSPLFTMSATAAELTGFWLTTPHPELGDVSPIEAAVEEFGARQVEEILQGILHGLPA